MKTKLVGKNIEITKAMEDAVEKKIAVLDKYLLIDDAVTARVLARTYPYAQKVEITVPTKVGILRAEVVKDDFYEALDFAVDKLEDQIRRQKTRLQKRHKEHLSKAFIEEFGVDEQFDVDIPVKTKNIRIVEMDLDEAIMQMELSGHDFYVYKDVDTDGVSVVYRRNTGGYGCMEVI